MSTSYATPLEKPLHTFAVGRMWHLKLLQLFKYRNCRQFILLFGLVNWGWTQRVENGINGNVDPTFIFYF